MNNYSQSSFGASATPGGIGKTPLFGQNVPPVPCDWDEIGSKIALVGGICPLLIGAVLLLTTIVYRGLFGVSAVDVASSRLLVELGVMMILGLPFLAYASFLLSSLTTSLTVSTMLRIGQKFQLRVVPCCVRTCSGVTLGLLWFALIVFAASA